MASNIVESVESVTRLPFNSKFNQRSFDYDPDFLEENYENRYGKIKDSLKALLNGFFEYYHKV